MTAHWREAAPGVRGLWRLLTGRTCVGGRKHDPDGATFDPWSLLTECRRCGRLV